MCLLHPKALLFVVGLAFVGTTCTKACNLHFASRKRSDFSDIPYRVAHLQSEVWYEEFVLRIVLRRLLWKFPQILQKFQAFAL